MATPRKLLVDPNTPLHYHLVSRCVRRSFLCGRDPLSGVDYEHRKTWIEERLLLLAESFAVEVNAYAIMSNHLHLVVYYDPKACEDWSDAEVARRWMRAFPVRGKDRSIDDELTALRLAELAADKTELEKRRSQLGSLSMFMKHLKQPISLRANREDGCGGHFFEQRFYSGALLDEQSLTAAMVYVDLNPIRAKIAKRIEECRHTSVQKRLHHLRNSETRLHDALVPVCSGLRAKPNRVRMTYRDYFSLLRAYAREERILQKRSAEKLTHRLTKLTQIRFFQKRQRAFGASETLLAWLNSRGFRHIEEALPA